MITEVRFRPGFLTVSIPVRGRGYGKLSTLAFVRPLVREFPSPLGEEVMESCTAILQFAIKRGFPSPLGEEVMESQKIGSTI
ncbi:hypothetical protein N9414_03418 [Nodularia spumigena CCY9414]|nr:hypothetical protein N9414_03418 [Nodularia spumigena CCY9414]